MKKLFSRSQIVKAVVALLALTPVLAFSATVNVSNVTQLRNAMANAVSGDIIVVAAGTYAPTSQLSAETLSEANGGAPRAVAPMFMLINKTNITIKAASATNKPLLKGLAPTDGNYVFYAQKANGLRIENIIFSNSTKGVVIDRSDSVDFINSEVRYTGEEGLHLRDGSDGALIKGSKFHLIGFERKDRGEGVYICNDMKKWHPAHTVPTDDIYQQTCNNTIVENNTFGPDIGAEHIDIKEGVTGTIVRNNTFVGALTDATIMASAGDYTKSLVHDKGANSRIYSNSFNVSNAKWDPTLVERGAIRVEQVIDSPDYGHNIFGHGSAVVKNDMTNDNGNTYTVYMPTDASAVSGCNTNDVGNAGFWGSKATVTMVSGTGCDNYDPN